MAFQPLPEAVLLHARQAFVLVLTEQGVSAPMNEITADTILGRDGKHVQIFWRQGLSRRISAEGRFYPGASGGTIHLDFLQSIRGTPQPHKYVFSVTEDGCLQLTVVP
mgnify:FL=1